MNIPSEQSGQGLLETIIAISVVVVGLVGAITLVNFALRSTTSSQSRIIALNLAWEGVEVMINKRDSNLLAKSPFSTGISGGDGTAIVSFNSAANTWGIDFTPNAITDAAALLHREAGIYKQASSTPSGVPTKFRRLLNIDDSNPDAILITSTVQWSDASGQKEVVAERTLYDWVGSLATLSPPPATPPPPALPGCGDGTVDTGEQCDDGNTNNFDVCSSTCQLETISIATKFSAGAGAVAMDSLEIGGNRHFAVVNPTNQSATVYNATGGVIKAFVHNVPAAPNTGPIVMEEPRGVLLDTDNGVTVSDRRGRILVVRYDFTTGSGRNLYNFGITNLDDLAGTGSQLGPVLAGSKDAASDHIRIYGYVGAPNPSVISLGSPQIGLTDISAFGGVPGVSNPTVLGSTAGSNEYYVIKLTGNSSSRKPGISSQGIAQTATNIIWFIDGPNLKAMNTDSGGLVASIAHGMANPIDLAAHANESIQSYPVFILDGSTGEIKEALLQ